MTNYTLLPRASQHKDNLSQSRSTVADVLDGKGIGIFSVKSTDKVHDVVWVLKERRVGALVISDDRDAALGILSERDIIRRMAKTLGLTLPQLVKDLTNRNVEACMPQDRVMEVLKRMSEDRFRHMSVITDGRLGLMIAIGDLVSFRLKELEYETLQMRQMIVG